mgnify:FL=1
MEKTLFLKEALIHIGAALVKCYDEQSDGIVGNRNAQKQLAEDANNIANELLSNAEKSGCFDY